MGGIEGGQERAPAAPPCPARRPPAAGSGGGTARGHAAGGGLGARARVGRGQVGGCCLAACGPPIRVVGGSHGK